MTVPQCHSLAWRDPRVNAAPKTRPAGRGHPSAAPRQRTVIRSCRNGQATAEASFGVTHIHYREGRRRHPCRPGQLRLPPDRTVVTIRRPGASLEPRRGHGRHHRQWRLENRVRCSQVDMGHPATQRPCRGAVLAPGRAVEATPRSRRALS